MSGIYQFGKQITPSANEISSLVTQLTTNKQDKRINWEGEDLLLTTVLQRINNSAVGKANIVVANELPETLQPNTQYWVKTYNSQTLDNGCFIIIVDNLGTSHFAGQSATTPGETQTDTFTIVKGTVQYSITNKLNKTDILMSCKMNNAPVLINYVVSASNITFNIDAEVAEDLDGTVININYI